MSPNRRDWIPKLARVILAVAGPCVLAGAALPSWPGHGGVAGFAWTALAALLLVAWVIILIPHQRHDTRWARQHSLIWWGLLAAGSSAIAIALIGQNIHANWSVIDDHDYVAILGPQGRMTAGQLAHSILNSNEIGHPTIESRRYRPTFWLLRLIEIFLWGNHPALYWATRIAMFAISICLAWWALWVWLGGPASGLVLTWLLTFPFWSDIWCRLGCSEAHATLGTAMVGAATAAIVLETCRLGSPRRARWNSYWALLAVGAILAVGAKENFLILLPIVWVFMAWVARRRSLGTVPWLAGTAITLAGFWIAGVIMVATSHAGVDVYQQPTGMVHRSQALIDWMKTGVGATWGCLACVAVGLMAIIFFAGRPGLAQRRRRHAVLSSGLLFFLLAAMVLSQVFFYNGTFPSRDHTRYDFPGLIAAALAAVAVVKLMMGLLAPLPPGEGGRYSGRVRARPTINPRTNGALSPQNPVSTVLPRPHPAGRPATLSRPGRGERGTIPRALLLVALGLLVMNRGFEPIALAGARNVRETQNFMNKIEKISLRARIQPQRPLLFVAYRPDNLEYVTSVLVFLRASQVTNPAFLMTRFATKNFADPEDRQLAGTLERASTNGESGFRPIKEYHPGQFPIGLFFDYDGDKNRFSESIEVLLTLTSGGPTATAAPHAIDNAP